MCLFESKVNKIDIQYDKVSKQVDVHALKEVLWNHIHTSAETDNRVRQMLS
jgi:condensin complex subunit 2